MGNLQFDLQKPLKRSQKFMVAAYILVFIAQFFTFGFSSYYVSTTGGGMILTNEYKVEQNGWHYHHWFYGIVMAAIAYIFFTKSPHVGWYWAAAVVCLILGLGGWLGLVSIGLAGYAVYLKYKERKKV